MSASELGNGSIYDRIQAGEWDIDKHSDYPVRYADKEANRIARLAYNVKASDLLRSFRTALCDEYGVRGKVADLIWDKAWQDGHSEGLYSVYQSFDEISGFVDKVREAIKSGG
jgi:hypothetical protein